MLAGRSGRRQRYAEAGAVGHSPQEVEAGGFAFALSSRLLQPRDILWLLAALSTAIMAIGQRLTKAHYSAVRTEYSLYACFARAAGAAESGTSCEAHGERAIRADVSAERSAGAPTNGSHQGT